MLLDSVRSLIDEISDDVGTVPWMEVHTASTGDRALPAALGIGKKDSEFRLAVFGEDPAVVAAIAARANGEADEYVIPMLQPRVTSGWTQQPRDPLVIGQQVGPVGLGWVGTGGLYVRAAEDPTVILQITNEHVTGEHAPRGRVMHQGGRNYGVVWKVGGLSFAASQKYDVGSVAVDRGRAINPLFDHGIDDNLVGIRRMAPDDIGRQFANTGQTRGTMFGSCLAVDVRDVRVGYDGGVGRFHDQAVFVGRDGQPFSVPGHSGSTIVCVSDKHGCALLFAGVRDALGRDLTFANADLPGAVVAAGGTPQLAA